MLQEASHFFAVPLTRWTGSTTVGDVFRVPELKKRRIVGVAAALTRHLNSPQPVGASFRVFTTFLH